MDTSQSLALYDQDQRRDVGYPLMRRGVMPNVARDVDLAGNDLQEGNHPGEAELIHSQPSEATAEDAIHGQVKGGGGGG